ncbi:MAG TPA: ATP-dependent DNA helicase [Thermoleophilaceae bacterium]|nr:ATP-dependent DNA helicase [Thermoleophilaceae bacterium]
MLAVLSAGLTEPQRAAASHPGGALAVTGVAGSGKTTVLAHRFAWLAAPEREGAVRPERLLMLVHSSHAREAMCGLLGELVEPPYEELHVQTFDELCRALLADEALEAGLDPLFVPMTRADRVALLLDRLGDLTLRHHEIRGNPAPLLASFVERIDRLKEQMTTPEELLERTRAELAVAAEASDAARALAAREVEFAQLYADHDRLLADRGALDSGDLVLTAFRLLHERPHVRERAARRFDHVLIDEYQEATFAQGMVLRLLCEEHGQVTVAGDDAQTLRRFGDVGGRNLADFPREYPDATVVDLGPSRRWPDPIAQVATAVAPPGDARMRDLHRPGGTILHLAGVEGGPTGQMQGSHRPGGTSVHRAVGGGDVRFWRCASERAQAQAVALHVERLLAGGADPAAIAVMVRSAADDGTAVGGALEQRAIPFRVRGPGAFFQRAEVRDVLAWLRVLADPADSGAAVRALTRPPIGLHSVDIARLTQLARRRKLDMPSAVAAALDGPQLSPEGRDRAQAFLDLYRAAARAFESRRPDAFVLRLIERVGIRRQQVFATQADTVERLRNIARLPELATAYMRREPNATPRDFTRYLKAVADSGLPETEATGPEGAPAVAILGIDDAKGREFDHVFVLGLSAARMPGRPPALEPDALAVEAGPTTAPAVAPTHEQVMRRRLHIALSRARRSLVLSWSDAPNGSPARPSPFYEEARMAAGAPEERFEEELFGPAEGLHSTFRIMRDELLDTVQRIGGRLGEMRLDTTLDVSQAVARYLELLKVAALIERSKDGQPLDDAISEVNQLLAAGASAEQRAVLESSALDDWLRDTGRDPDRRPVAGDDHAGPSLDPFIPRRRGAGAPEGGLMLSASDIETYRLCPLKYKFGRVFRIPQESTIHQRFGIALHTVLERFHKSPDAGRETLFELFESSWRRGGFGDSDDELQFRERGIEALERYWENTRDQEGEPVWFERSFSFQLGPHVIRGRVDRVDRRPDGSYEVIDYKTGRSKTAAELQSDVQLSIYQMGARESWGIETSAHSYYYVMTAEKVPVAHSDTELDRVRATIEEIGAGISRQDFQPTPSHEICSFCDFRIICPAAER